MASHSGFESSNKASIISYYRSAGSSVSDISSISSPVKTLQAMPAPMGRGRRPAAAPLFSTAQHTSLCGVFSLWKRHSCSASFKYKKRCCCCSFSGTRRTRTSTLE